MPRSVKRSKAERAAKKTKAEQHRDAASEPVWDEDDRVVGTTGWGFPFGPTESELREMAAHDSPEAGWARAKRILETVVPRWAGNDAEVDVGYVNRVGEGLSRDVFAAEVGISMRAHELAVLLPRRRRRDEQADPELPKRTAKEALLLRALSSLELPFRVPTLLGICADGAGGVAMVRSYERGAPLDLRRSPSWAIWGSVAAAVHRIEHEALVWSEHRFATRAEHALALAAELEDLPAPEVVDARAWMLEHLPPPTPASLLHGDLLGQNILLPFEGAPAVIDWEYACVGDPAYDVAIVTRGVREPFKQARGMDLLLEAYTRAGGGEVTRKHVQLHELSMAGGWYRSALAGESQEPPAQVLLRLRGILRRAASG